jgi:leader peptidase (prepilin peptidase) / N-methyltransferase
MPFRLPGPPLAGFAMYDAADAEHRLTLIALAAFSTLWVTALGAAVGSFLNVVVYRLPRGMSLVRPKSHCPACGASIRAGDNIPVLGWLRLRGRCRDCASAISVRYPLVEAATALLFLGLAHVELFTGGSNLPGGPERSTGLGFVLWHLRPALVALYAYHAVLLTTLLCLSLIAWDGLPPPRQVLVPVSLIGLAVPLFIDVRPVLSGFVPASAFTFWSLWKVGGAPIGIVPAMPADCLVGGAIGVVIGALVAPAVPVGATAASDRRGTLAVGVLIGLFLGWQAAVTCGLLAAILALLNAVVSRLTKKPLPMTALLAAAAIVQIAFWRELSASTFWPGPLGWQTLRSVGWPETAFVPTSLTTAAALTGVLAFIAGRLARGSAIAAVPPAEAPVGEDIAEPAPR